MYDLEPKSDETSDCPKLRNILTREPVVHDVPKANSYKTTNTDQPPEKESSVQISLPRTRRRSSRKKPWGTLSYAELIFQAISSAEKQKLMLTQIYDWIVTNVPFFSDKGDMAGWKNSVRHNLSLYDCFVRKDSAGEKSSWWTINPKAKFERTGRKKVVRPHEYEKKCGRPIKQAKIVRKNNPNNFSFTKEGDLFPGNLLHNIAYSQSCSYHLRVPNCAPSFQRLSYIPEDSDRIEWTPEYVYNSGSISREQNIIADPYQPYQATQILLSEQRQVDSVPTYYQNELYQPPWEEAQTLSTVYVIPQTLCPVHQIEGCSCNVNVLQIPSMLTSYNQSHLWDREIEIPFYGIDNHQYTEMMSQPCLAATQEAFATDR